MTSGIFQDWAQRYWATGFSAIPVVAETKRPAVSNWSGFSFNLPKAETRAIWSSTYATSSLGICLGTPLSESHVLFAIDVDDDIWVEPIRALLGTVPCAKRGKKGQTIFVRVPVADRMKATVIMNHDKRQVIDILGPKKQTILPPSVHPETKGEYHWIGKSLLEISAGEELPEFDRAALQALKVIVGSEEALVIMGGKATHDACLRLTAKLVRAGLLDEQITAVMHALFGKNYKGDSLDELPELLASARQKSFEATLPAASEAYLAGALGPIPLGYAGNEFIFRHQQTREVVRRSGAQLIMPSGLFELASKDFWASQFPKMNKNGETYGIDYISAGDALIQACRGVGAIDVSNIRGIGVWPEEGRLIINLGGEEITSSRFIYTTPKPLILARSAVSFDVILEFLRKPNWVTASAPEMLLGWAVASVICGGLPWRPHAGVTGPAQAGKSTILRGLGHILTPLAIIKEGISTEAGIRQSIGYDARPVILDELEPESSRDRGRVERIIKLMRSSSSATGGVARGTPEGKAVTFNTRAMFLVGAINLYRISAADTSRLLRFELAKVPTDQGRRSHLEVIDLLGHLESIGPAFCQYVLDHAAAILASRPLIHRAVPVVQERQADNLATVLAGYWVAFNGRSITGSEAEKLAEQHVAAIDEQREGVELDDATECLNVLLGSTVNQIVTEDAEAGPRSHREPALIGTVLARAVAARSNSGDDLQLLRQLGIRPENDGFLVANSHPGLKKIYRETRWEGGMWSSALSRLDGAQKTAQKRFADGVRSLGVWIPASHLPEIEDPAF